MRNVIMLLLYCSIAVLTIFSTCRKNRPNCHTTFLIKNNSDSDIYFIWDGDTAVNRLNYPPGLAPGTYKCKSNSKIICALHNSCFESHLNSSSLHLLSIFIFDAKVIETIPWDTIKKNFLILRKYSLTKAQLDSANWIINYP